MASVLHGQCGKDTQQYCTLTALEGVIYSSSSAGFGAAGLAGGTYRFLQGLPDIHVVFGYLSWRCHFALI